jgi:predicted TIM-barrel fold metal-dependent hydrolase
VNHVKILDAHNHIGYSVAYGELSAEDLIKQMDAAKIDMAVVFSINVAGKVDNDYVAKSVKKYPNRLIGFALVDPQWGDDAVNELKRCVTKLGMKGLKLHPDITGYAIDNHALTDPIFEICTKYKLPIVSHAGGDNPRTMPLQFEEMAKTFPDVKIMMAHMGVWQSFEPARRVAKRNDNLFLDTAGNPFVLSIKDAVEQVGADKVVMGTDTPSGDFQVSLKIIERAVAKAQDRELVMGGTLKRILGI